VGGAALLEWRNAPTAQARQAANLVERADIVRRDDMADSAERSVGLYRQALALVPDDAATWGKLALALGEIVESATPDQAASAVAATQIAARRGLDLQPGLADARVALAMLLPHFGSWLPVERTLRAILAEAPDNVAARRNLAVLLMEVGRVREGAAIMDRLVEREPLSPDLQYRHVYQLWARGRLREADQVADRSLQLWPRHPAVWLSRVWTFGLTGRTSAALAMINDDAGRPDLPAPLVNLLRINCTALATRTDRDVKAAIAANMAAARQGQFGVVSATLTLPQLGAADVAYQIDRGYLVREGPLVGLLRRPLGEPILSQQNRHTMALWMPSAAPLRAEPGFLSLCADMGMMAYWREGGHWPDFLGNRPPT
jgi:tetratricopeptide (TPR) repeat protein